MVLLAGSSGGGSSDYASQAHAGSKQSVEADIDVCSPSVLAVIPFITFINFRFKPCTKDSV